MSKKNIYFDRYKENILYKNNNSLLLKMVLFHLSEFVSNKNNCVHCIMDKCSNKDHKKDANMKRITKYVNKLY
jgi:hypothetical protein